MKRLLCVLSGMDSGGAETLCPVLLSATVAL